MNQTQRKPEEAETKLIRLNQEKRITHFGRCFVELHLKDKQLILKAPDSTPLFTSNFDPIIFIQRHNFLFAVDTVAYNDYVLVCPTVDVCTQVLDAIKRWKTMEATNDMMEEFFFKHHFYIPIFNEVKAGVAGAYEMKADMLELVVLLNCQKCQEYMNLALKILDVPPPPVHQHQFFQDQVHNNLNAQMGHPTNPSDITVFSGSHLSGTVALVDGMNSDAVPGSSDKHSSRKRKPQNVSCEESQAIPTAHQHQSLHDQSSSYPTDNSNSFDGTVLHASRLSDNSSLVDGMNSEAVPGSSTEHSSRTRKLQIVSDMDIEAYFNDDGEDTPSRSFVPGKTVEHSPCKRSSQNVNWQSIPTAHQDQINNDNEIQWEDPTDNSYPFDNTVLHESRLSDTSSFVDGLYVTSDTVRRSSNERSSRKRKLQPVSYEGMEYSGEDEEEDCNGSLTEDIIKLPGYKLYEREYCGKMYRRLFIFDGTSSSLGHDFSFHSTSNTFYCRPCKEKFGVSITAKIIKDENGEYVKLRNGNHKCERKEFQLVQKENRLIVTDESRIVKLPHYKLYQKQWGKKLNKRLAIFDPSNPSLGYEFNYRSAKNDYYCWECYTKFGTLVCAKLVEDETGDYIQFGIRDHLCTPKDFNQ